MIVGKILPTVLKEIANLTPDQPNHADVFNAKLQELLDNDLTLNSEIRQYINTQISQVVTTGVPKLVSYPYSLKATANNQVDFLIPLSSFNKDTDTTLVFQNGNLLKPSDYSVILNGDGTNKISLLKGVVETTEIDLVILKNVPMGPDGSVDGNIIIPNSIPLNRLKGEVILRDEYAAHVLQESTVDAPGHVQLSNEISGTSQTKAATEIAVKNAKEAAIDWAKGFGLGGIAKNISGTNLDDLDENGFYMGSNVIGAPSNGWWFFLNLKHDSLYRSQIAIGFSDSNKQILQRNQTNSLFTTWTSYLSTDSVIQGQFKKVLEFDTSGQSTFSIPNLANYDEFEIVLKDLVGNRPTASNLNLVIAMNDDVPSLGQFGGLKTANGITGLFSSNSSTSNANLTTFQTPGTAGSFIINVTIKFKKMGYNTWKLTGETMALRNQSGVNSMASTDYILGSFGGATAQLNKVTIRASDSIGFNSGRAELWVKN